MERLSLENLFGELIDLRWAMGISTVEFELMLEDAGCASAAPSIYTIESSYRRHGKLPAMKILIAYARALGVEIEVRCTPRTPPIEES